MSRFFSHKYSSLTPYTPGEQPRNKRYIKLNTNESPFPPSSGVIEAVAGEASNLMLYSDPELTALTESLAALLGVGRENVIMSNGSDEVLNFAFMAFMDESSGVVFPDITYGFYPVFARLNGIPYEEIPLKEDFTVDPADYIGVGKNIVIANPNAPTGIALPLSDIERIIASNSDKVVVIDEAYVDFGGESAVPLINKYDNLIVTGTFSKSRSMAGARLGFGVASAALIADMNTLRFSTNPYNVNRMTSAAGVAAIKDNGYYMDNCKVIEENREYTRGELESLGFRVLESKTNFLFAESDRIDGEELYLALKERGILVRHFTLSRIKNFNRITIGTMEDMRTLVAEIKNILEERAK